MPNEIVLPLTPGVSVAPVGARRQNLSPYVAETEQGDTSQFELGNFIRIIREWRWLILGAIALSLAGAVVVTLLTTRLYRAAVTLEVNPPTVEILDEKSRERAPAADLWAFISTQVGLLSSRSLADRVAQDLNLASNKEFVGEDEDATERLRLASTRVSEGLKVQPPEDSQLIEFTFVAKSPALAAEIANGIAENFISMSLQRRFEASTYARTFLQQQIAKTRRDLEKSERAQVAYAQAEGIINTSQEARPGAQGGTGSLQGDSLVALNSALADATALRVQAEGAYRQAQMASGSAEVNDNTRELRQARAQLEAEYQDKRTMMKPEHPEMLSLRSRITELDRQISRERSQIASGRVNSLLAAFRAAASAEAGLQARVNQLKGSVLNLRGRSIQYNILQREVDTNRALYDALLQRYKEIGVAGGIGTTPISIVDRAAIPTRPYKPNLVMNLLIGLAFGLIAGILTALALEILNDTVKTREDVRTKLGLPCLGAVPKRRGKGSLIEDLSDPTTPVSEAYSAIVATLRFSTESGTPKTMLVSSTRPSEGKSSSALAVAQNQARRGARVLLIDADLRRPAFKTASKDRGLTKLLTAEDTIANHILPTQYENLWLLPAGPSPPNPADLLSTQRFKHVLAEAASQYDSVIVDGPPVLGLADASLLAASVRNVMVVIESGKTRTRAAREAIERLQDTGAHILGVTLSKAAEEKSSYYGYSMYRYGTQVQDQSSRIMIAQTADAG